MIHIRRLKNKGMEPYRCRLCGNWHIANSRTDWKVQARIDQLLQRRRASPPSGRASAESRKSGDEILVHFARWSGPDYLANSTLTVSRPCDPHR